MIIVKIQGGLGNQLIQYSFGQALKAASGQDVLYDLSFFETNTKYTKRPYLLNRFKTHVTEATQEEIENVKFPHGNLSKAAALVNKILNKYVFDAYDVGYTEGLIAKQAAKKNSYNEGYWQSYKYYESILQELQKDIQLVDEAVLLDFIKRTDFSSTNSISVHIRRGDFLNANAGTTTLPISYYKEALNRMNDLHPDATYFVFSDDIVWVKEELGVYLGEGVVFVSGEGLKDYEEFALMMRCRHAIIANSTFSWFSTLLTDSKQKTVIYSSDWKNKYLNGDPHICPPHWISL